MSTCFLKRWSPVNQAWIVWRDDDGHQSGVRIHNDEADADQDLRDREQFMAMVQDQEFKQWAYFG